MIAVTSFGPRLLSLRFAGGENLLYEDDSGFMVGAWRLQGGHRFTVAPEAEEQHWQVFPPATVSRTWADEGRLADEVLPLTERSFQ